MARPANLCQPSHTPLIQILDSPRAVWYLIYSGECSQGDKTNSLYTPPGIMNRTHAANLTSIRKLLGRSACVPVDCFFPDSTYASGCIWRWEPTATLHKRNTLRRKCPISCDCTVLPENISSDESNDDLDANIIRNRF